VVSDYVRRLIDPVLADTLSGLPAIMLTGPRACGKTTTARRHAAQIVRLDRAGEAFAFTVDPDDALRHTTEPVLFDEWQRVPEVLGAIKRALDDDAYAPNRFLLTGSALPPDPEDEDGPTYEWLGTGRVVDVRMDPLTRREIVGRVDGRLFLDRLREGQLDSFRAGEAATLSSYLAWALEGGFPEVALNVPASHRRRWLTGYIHRLVTRDVRDLAGARDADGLRRYLTALAANTAGVVQNKTLYEVADIAASTARAYDRLLRNLFVLDVVPAWSTNRLTRLIDTPKRHLVDASLVGGLLGVTVESALRDGDLLGRILETFALAQLRPETQVSRAEPRLYHLRDKDGRHEIDLVVEYADAAVAAVEVKATTAPTARDFLHLRWLRDILGERFVRGVLLHTGSATVALDDRIVAAPLSTIWL